jgi:hypothetical protein
MPETLDGLFLAENLYVRWDEPIGVFKIETAFSSAGASLPLFIGFAILCSIVSRASSECPHYQAFVCDLVPFGV